MDHNLTFHLQYIRFDKATLATLYESVTVAFEVFRLLKYAPRFISLLFKLVGDYAQIRNNPRLLGRIWTL